VDLLRLPRLEAVEVEEEARRREDVRLHHLLRGEAAHGGERLHVHGHSWGAGGAGAGAVEGAAGRELAARARAITTRRSSAAPRAAAGPWSGATSAEIDVTMLPAAPSSRSRRSPIERPRTKPVPDAARARTIAPTRRSLSAPPGGVRNAVRSA